MTRWFQRNRGLAIGIVHLPIVITFMPLAASLVIGRFGLTVLFLVLALFAAMTLIPGSMGWLPEVVAGICRAIGRTLARVNRQPGAGIAQAGRAARGILVGGG